MRPNIDEFSEPLQEELRYRMDLEEEGDEFAGFAPDVLWIHREFMDIDDLCYHDDGWKQFRREMRLWWVRQGIYRETTKEELDRTTVWSSRSGSSRGKADFRVNGRMYVFHKHPDGYFDESA